MRHTRTLIGSLIKLGVIIIIFIMALSFGIIGACIMGNQWYTTEGVLQTIQLTNPDAEKVLSSKRSVFSKSEMLVEHKDGTRKTYYLDSDIFFNYTVIE